MLEFLFSLGHPKLFHNPLLNSHNFNHLTQEIYSSDLDSVDCIRQLQSQA